MGNESGRFSGSAHPSGRSVAAASAAWGAALRCAAVLIALVAPAAPARATVASDLCTGDPCIVATSAVVAAGSTLDFGSAELRISPGVILTVGAGGSPRSIAISARQVSLEPGAAIEGGGDRATVSIVSTAGSVHLRADGDTLSRIDLSAISPGQLTIQSSHDLLVDGVIDVEGTGTGEVGGITEGVVDLDCNGTAALAGPILAGASGASATGGSVSVHAGSGIVATGAIDASAPAGLGSVVLQTVSGSISTAGPITADGGSPEGPGGDVTLTGGSGGHVVVGALLSVTGGSDVSGCGVGGTVALDSSQSIRMSADVRLDGGTGCQGGVFGAVAGTTFSQDEGRSIAARGVGVGAAGGVIDVVADRDAVLRGLDVSGPAGGGDVSVVSQLGTVAFGGTVTATGGGSIAAEGCTVFVQPTGTLDTRNGGTHALVAHGALSVAGTMLAGTGGSNALTVRVGGPSLMGATIVPDPTVTVDGNLSRCSVIFFDDFETGTLERWSLASTKGGKLSVEGDASRNGRFGLSLNVTGLPPPATKAKIWVKDTTPEAEDDYHARFSLKLNDLVVATDPRILRMMAGRTSGDPTSRPFEIRLRYASAAWQIYGVVRDDTGKGWQTPPIPIGRGWVTIALDWWRASGPDVANGGLQLSVDDAEAVSPPVKNAAARIDGVQLGFVGGLGLSSTGTAFMDDFESTRQLEPPPT